MHNRTRISGKTHHQINRSGLGLCMEALEGKQKNSILITISVRLATGEAVPTQLLRQYLSSNKAARRQGVAVAMQKEERKSRIPVPCVLNVLFVF